jgi:hypothetical protein
MGEEKRTRIRWLRSSGREKEKLCRSLNPRNSKEIHRSVALFGRSLTREDDSSFFSFLHSFLPTYRPSFDIHHRHGKEDGEEDLEKHSGLEVLFVFNFFCFHFVRSKTSFPFLVRFWDYLKCHGSDRSENPS